MVRGSTAKISENGGGSLRAQECKLIKRGDHDQLLFMAGLMSVCSAAEETLSSLSQGRLFGRVGVEFIASELNQ